MKEAVKTEDRIKSALVAKLKLTDFSLCAAQSLAS